MDDSTCRRDAMTRGLGGDWNTEGSTSALFSILGPLVTTGSSARHVGLIDIQVLVLRQLW